MKRPRLSMASPGVRGRNASTHVSSLVLLLQRSPLLQLLPEARIISASGFSAALGFTVTAIAGLGAFDAVSGATEVAQNPKPPVQPEVVNMTGGAFSIFNWTVSGFTGSLTPGTWVISGTLPQGLIHGDLKESRSSFISGVPVEVGSFPVTLTLWEFSDQSGRSISGDFNIVVAAPPAPAISVHPLGGNFLEGGFVSLTATQTSGFDFTWTREGQPLTPDSTLIVSSAAARRYRVPTVNPGNTWRSGDTFDDSSWTPVSGGIGYDQDASPVNFVPLIAAGGNVQSLMTVANRDTAHIRVPFTLTGSTPITNLRLRVQSDDGFVAWLNGTEIASQNPVAGLAWNSPAGARAVDSQAAQFREIDVSRSIIALRAGVNLLAVQAMNYDVDAPGDRDFLFNCELVGGVDEGTHTRRLIIPAINSNQAGVYRLEITNPTGSVTSDPAAVVMPPQIESHPADITIASGQTATLTVEAIIAPPWTYQWYRGPSGNISQPVAGATAVSFTTPALTQTETYWVRVTNSAGSVDSDAATVTVMPAGGPPVISAGPSPVTVDAGTAAELSVSVTGTGPFTYQWYTGTSGNTAGLVTGATAPSFTTPLLTAPATYWVRVANSGGTADSVTASVSIRDPFLTWKNSFFTVPELNDPVVSGPAADPDGDGTGNEREYIFGTSPKIAQPALTPSIIRSGGNVVLTFTAVAAAGPGYAGRTRHYAIETTAALAAGPWTPVPAFTDVIASNQEISFSMAPSSAPAFCRLRVWLTP